MLFFLMLIAVGFPLLNDSGSTWVILPAVTDPRSKGRSFPVLAMQCIRQPKHWCNTFWQDNKNLIQAIFAACKHSYADTFIYKI
ncbi:hypothetical protein AV650_20385 [Serratia fonticola]|nr:hypothetical protein AV650_20385 [Serratia fonticola]